MNNFYSWHSWIFEIMSFIFTNINNLSKIREQKDT